MQSDLRRKALHDVLLEKKKINLPYEEIKAETHQQASCTCLFNNNKKMTVDVSDKDKWTDKFERDLGAENW